MQIMTCRTMSSCATMTRATSASIRCAVSRKWAMSIESVWPFSMVLPPSRSSAIYEQNRNDGEDGQQDNQADRNDTGEFTHLPGLDHLAPGFFIKFFERDIPPLFCHHNARRANC